ncbi:MAG: segregation/condensation protein A [Candidatus Moduliflexus flocculans]|nr:segregation/condensation protein A [Candidatus Moduliflexus flocculans]
MYSRALTLVFAPVQNLIFEALLLACPKLAAEIPAPRGRLRPAAPAGVAVPDGYQVRLDVFEGPLDLLLFLIRKKKIDIHDIPIAAITRDYLEYLERKTEINLDREAEFLFIAALLIYIKSQMLLPRETDLAEHEDPRRVLVDRLVEYEKVKAACSLLREREDVQILQWKRDFIPPLAGESELEPVELSLFDLAESFFLMMKRRAADDTRDHPRPGRLDRGQDEGARGAPPRPADDRLPRVLRGPRHARGGPGLLLLHPRAGQVPGGRGRPGRALPDDPGLAPQGRAQDGCP